MPNFSDTEEMKKQYATDGNLNARVALHRLFSTNKMGWSSWVFGNYRLGPGQDILELGCGNAGIWRANAPKIPKDIKLVLSDISAGMLDAARQNTRDIGIEIEYIVIDAQSIPYADNRFDAVIANHMLYHMPDIHKTLGEAARVLKPGGTFYATAIGNNNLKEIVDFLFQFDPVIDFAMDSITRAFGLESGGPLLARHFHSVECIRYEDSLHITEPKPLIDYILSSQGIGNVNEIIAGERVEPFCRYIEGLFSATGYVDVRKDAGMFVAKK